MNPTHFAFVAEKIDISIVIPAFNEARRLPLFLNRVISFCRRTPRTYEIIVVDDGSGDDTFQIAGSYKTSFPRLSVLRMKMNRGKGYAVKQGIFHAKGDICLYMDADGSVQPEEIEKNLHYLQKERYDIFIGSRVLQNEEQVLKVKWYRKIPGVAFNFLVRFFLFKEIKDTQCGFKLFKREVARSLFGRSYLRGFGFDIEILYLASRMGYKIKEGPVSWRHVHGSKFNLLSDAVRMFFNILQVKDWHRCASIDPSARYLGQAEYDSMYEMEERHWWFTSHRDLAVRLVRSLPLTNPTLLDVGCGTGGKLTAFGRLGNAVGIEVSEKAVAFCKGRGLSRLIQASAEQLPFLSKTFEVVTCLEVLEHVEDPVAVLQELKRVLKDDGKLILSLPAFKLLWSRHDEALCHFRRYDKNLLLIELEEAGLKVEKTGYLFCIPSFVVAPIRIARRFFIWNQAKGPVSDTTTLPPWPINGAMRLLCSMELWLSLKLGLPFGTTIYAVASRPEAAEPHAEIP